MVLVDGTYNWVLIMILSNLDEINNNKYDVCIVGSGPAGITTAISLASTVKVLILEAGNIEYSEKSQEFFTGKVVGDDYYDLKICRLRQMGGASGHWGGKCRTLDDFDFAHKDYSPEANWPIQKSDLDKHLLKAASILKINPAFKNSSYAWDSNIENIPFEFSPPVRFKQQYFDFIAKSKNIDLIANTAVSAVRLADSSIKELILSNTLGLKGKLKAKTYVFAMGGIENGRMLKFIAVDNPTSALSKNKNVGAYWMDHPHCTIGDFYYDKAVGDHWHVGLSAQQKRKLKVLNCNLNLVPHIGHSDDGAAKKLLRELMCVNEKIGSQISLGLGKNYCGGRIDAAWEQEPNFNNAIDLDSKVDAFGVPKVILKFKISEIDLRTISSTAEYVAESMVKNGKAKIRLHEWLWGNKYPVEGSSWGPHHMGGTRMSKTKESGVVDPNLKCWDVSNLFMVGSSVFPSGGHANPTLTIVQLASRLADYLMKNP